MCSVVWARILDLLATGYKFPPNKEMHLFMFFSETYVAEPFYVCNHVSIEMFLYQSSKNIYA